jgi:hypothetical protein
MKREDSLALLRSMAGNAFDPRVVDKFIGHVEEFDQLIATEDIQEQVESEAMAHDYLTKTKPDAGLASNLLGTPNDDDAGFRSITEAQREVFALHEIAQTIGSSLNLNDTVTLVSNKLRAIVPFDTCIIFVVDEKSGRAIAAHAAGEHADLFNHRRMNVGDGITGWVIANARSSISWESLKKWLGVIEAYSFPRCFAKTAPSERSRFTPRAGLPIRPNTFACLSLFANMHPVLSTML